MKIEYTIQGKIPEKNFMLTRVNGEVRQSYEAKKWEYELRQLLKQDGIKGWTSRTDIEYGEYTPLRLDVKIYTPERPILVKQIKALQDALTGVAYMDDSAIVDLCAERIQNDEEYAELTIEPANKSYIRLPDEKAVILERPLRPIRANVWDEAGYFLDSKARKGDRDYMEYVRSEFSAQHGELIDKEFDMFAVIGAYSLKERTPLKDRLEAYDMDTFPIITPDADNCAYAILSALQKFSYDSPKDLVRLHIIKTYYNPGCGRNRIWLRNTRSKDCTITIGDYFS